MINKKQLGYIALSVIAALCIVYLGMPLLSNAASQKENMLEVTKEITSMEAGVKVATKVAEITVAETTVAETSVVETQSATTNASSTKSATANTAGTKVIPTQEPTQAPTEAPKAASSIIWEDINPISEWNINPFIRYSEVFTGDNLEVNVKLLQERQLSNLIEVKFGNQNQYKARCTVLSKLFNGEIAAYRVKGHGVFMLNENEGILLFNSAVKRFTRGTLSATEYANQCVNTIESTISTNMAAYMGVPNMAVYPNSTVITNTDTEWRAIVKVSYQGTLVSNQFIKANGYMTIVFDKSSEWVGLHTCVKANPTVEEWAELLESAKSYIYKVN